ncbi:NAD(P)-dependent oxidoreductase [Luteolibacter yonseiensis]|uniref:dTDP-4-dehydrorhamnose reductase n=1 Tax=Luteolibacter yonseiensis TaxID=1144680 RepID=A0A934R597_9BACT|nr:NAD(P)-dependent oxidoreductase [Luteolibacter yonseiensis]MBK1816481.1 NAD(P)-dependent oxidoreductase [Luteolibacter yonseiensis]
MKIAVTGTTGRVGAALVRHFSPNHEIVPLPRSICDLADPRSLASALEQLECDVFLNPAGITSLEMCEDHPELARRVNSDAPAEIASWAAARNVRVYHFSTDYVFAGEDPGLRDEEEIPHPLSAYGRSKLAGEDAVLAWPGNGVIRVSWVFGPEKTSFVDQIFEAALAGQPLAAISDKFSLPTFTSDLSQWTEHILSQHATGVLHACNSGEPVSWHDMAAAVVEEMLACGVISSLPGIGRQSLAEMRSFRAPRPRFTAMGTSRLAGLLGHPPRLWREALVEYVRSRCSGAC